MASHGVGYSETLKRPTEVTKGGRGMYCCVPQCGNSSYDRNKDKTNIGLFTIPSEKHPENRKRWVSILTSFRRKGGQDNFKITNATRVCEFHFKPEEIRISSGIGRKTLISGAVPSVFKFKEKKHWKEA